MIARTLTAYLTRMLPAVPGAADSLNAACGRNTAAPLETVPCECGERARSRDARLFLAVLGPMAMQNGCPKSLKMKPGGTKRRAQIDENEVLGALGGLWGTRRLQE